MSALLLVVVSLGTTPRGLTNTPSSAPKLVETICMVAGGCACSRHSDGLVPLAMHDTSYEGQPLVNVNVNKY